MAGPATDTLQAEHQTLLEGCGVLDRSERGRLALTGPGAIEFLGGQVTNELEGLQPGEGVYAAFLTHKGKMLGDLRILAVADPAGAVELLLDTERAALQGLFDMIRRFKIGYDVELHKRTLETGQLSLIGPRSEEVLALTGLAAAEHANTSVMVGSIGARAVRTDVGVDLIECLRIEHGRPRYGIDLDDTVIPQEAGLNERAVSFTKGCYVGQETVARLFYKGKPNRHLRGLRLSEPAAAGEELRLGERALGRLTSVADSPTLGPIGLALLRREAEVGAMVQLAGGAGAEVVELPFRRG
jgi:folate-binding protein YgfZ